MLSTGSEQQGQNISISDPDQNLGFSCIFSSGMQEMQNTWLEGLPTVLARLRFLNLLCKNKKKERLAVQFILCHDVNDEYRTI